MTPAAGRSGRLAPPPGRRRTGALLAIAALFVASCSSGGPASSATGGAPGMSTDQTAARTSLTVYAAASLATALDAATSTYEAIHPEIALTISTGSSAALATQIEQGAPADVFLSADTANPRKLLNRGLGAGPLVPFAGNLLTIVVPATNPGAVHSAADLARPGLKIVAAGDSVPVTKYAVQLVRNLAAEPGYPPDFATAYAANIVSKEDDVAAVVAKIALGEGDAAIVYVTDARTSPNVTTIDVPRAADVPATYAGVAIGASHDVAAAQAFLAWLAGPEGGAILRRFGFLPPP